MKRTISIIVIVVSCLVIVGATYWYVERRNAKPQTEETADAVDTREPVQEQETKNAEDFAQPQETIIPGKAETEPVPATDEPEMIPLPPPIDTYLLDLAKLPFLTLAKEEEKAQPSESGVLGSLPEDKQGIRLETAEAKTVTAETEKEQSAKSPEASEIPSAGEPADTVPEHVYPSSKETAEGTAAEQTTDGSESAVALPAENPPENGTGETDSSGLTLSLYFSGPTVQIPTTDKGFSAGIGLTRQNGAFLFGGILEFGMQGNTSSKQTTAGLLGMCGWSFGSGAVRYPLELQLGPTMIFSGTTSIQWGMTARISAGIDYQLTDSFRLFASLGMRYNLTFGSWDQQWIAEPIRFGVGIRF